MPHSCMQVSKGYTFCTCTIRCRHSTSSPGHLTFPLWSDNTLTNEMSIKQWLLTFKVISHFHLWSWLQAYAFQKSTSHAALANSLCFTLNGLITVSELNYFYTKKCIVQEFTPLCASYWKKLNLLAFSFCTSSPNKINVAAVERAVQISSTAYRILKAQTAVIFVFRSASFDNKRENASFGESPWQKWCSSAATMWPLLWP